MTGKPPRETAHDRLQSDIDIWDLWLNYLNRFPCQFFYALGKLMLDWERRLKDNRAVLTYVYYDQQDKIGKVRGVELPPLEEIEMVASVFGQINDPVVVEKMLESQDWAILVCLAGNLKKQKMGLVHNFSLHLSDAEIDCALRSIHSPANFRLPPALVIRNELTLTNTFKIKVDPFLKDLGPAFMYREGQWRIKDSIPDFHLYHSGLNRHIVSEFKIKKFKEEYISKMNGYIDDANAQLGLKGHSSCIGLLYCGEMDEQKVRMSLQHSKVPIAVTRFLLDGQIPKERMKLYVGGEKMTGR